MDEDVRDARRIRFGPIVFERVEVVEVGHIALDRDGVACCVAREKTNSPKARPGVNAVLCCSALGMDSGLIATVGAGCYGLVRSVALSRESRRKVFGSDNRFISETLKGGVTELFRVQLLRDSAIKRDGVGESRRSRR